MIELKNLSKAYRKNAKVLDNLELKINDGEIFGFIGPNGAGKTTTIKMITGILEPDKGNVLIDGIDINEKSIEAKKKIGFVPDDANMFLQLTGLEYLNFIADIYDISKESRKGEIDELSKKFELYDNLSDKIETYSHGMRQKIVIIGALIHNPQNLILDEPLTGLDPKSAYLLKQIMKEYSRSGKCVFFSTHILEVAEKLCDKIGIIRQGELVFLGTFDKLKAKYGTDKSLEEIFIELTTDLNEEGEI